MKRVLKNLLTTAMCLLIFIGSNCTLAYDHTTIDQQQSLAELVTYPGHDNENGVIRLMGDPMPGAH